MSGLIHGVACMMQLAAGALCSLVQIFSRALQDVCSVAPGCILQGRCCCSTVPLFHGCAIAMQVPQRKTCPQQPSKICSSMPSRCYIGVLQDVQSNISGCILAHVAAQVQPLCGNATHAGLDPDPANIGAVAGGHYAADKAGFAEQQQECVTCCQQALDAIAAQHACQG